MYRPLTHRRAAPLGVNIAAMNHYDTAYILLLRAAHLGAIILEEPCMKRQGASVDMLALLHTTIIVFSKVCLQHKVGV